MDWANIGLPSDEQAFAYEADDAPFAGDGTNRVLFAAYADVSAQSDMAASGLQWLPLGFSEDVGPDRRRCQRGLHKPLLRPP